MSLYIIGTIYNLSGDGETSAPVDGWHVNSTELLADIEDYRIEPATPKFVFMGVGTYCYKFDSEQQAKELLELE